MNNEQKYLFDLQGYIVLKNVVPKKIIESIEKLTRDLLNGSSSSLSEPARIIEWKDKKKDINILSLSVVRRDGSITPFKSDKISNAIKKAFLAQTKIRNNQDKDKEQKDNIHRTVDGLTYKVVAALTRRIADGDMIHIEDIQDQVELALMRDEHHKVARAYVLYREQRAASRYHTKKLKEQAGEKVSSMMVTKRDGTIEPVSLDKITNQWVLLVLHKL